VRLPIALTARPSVAGTKAKRARALSTLPKGAQPISTGIGSSTRSLSALPSPPASSTILTGGRATVGLFSGWPKNTMEA
jgi:hypothetical protein